DCSCERLGYETGCSPLKYARSDDTWSRPRNSNVGVDAVQSSLPITFSNVALRPTKRSANDNKVVRWLVSTLSRRGLRVLVEPIIPLAQPFCKPDLTVCNCDLVYVLDVCVVSGQSAESAWRTKVEKHCYLGRGFHQAYVGPTYS
ncbi:hypothetical protein FGIG_00036, partial [Fasciola gigantica]